MGRKRAEANARENITGKSGQIIRRFYEHVMGELIARPALARKIVKELEEAVGQERELQNFQFTLRTRESLEKRFLKLLGEAGLDNSQVKAGEVLLKKCVPDVAQIEYKGEHTTTHVVALPSGISSDEWTRLVNQGANPPQLVREPIEHE